MSRVKLVALVFIGAAALLSMAAAPTTTVRAKRPCTTAIALRDRVPIEQMLGTAAYTVPWLAASYETHTYIEGTEDDDGRGRVVAALAAARARNDGEGCTVDLFFLAHGEEFVSWVEAIPVDERPPLRLVYDTGAGDARQGPRWLDAGARTFVGHPGANLAPVFYAFFLPAWIRGGAIQDVVIESNKQTFVMIDSARPYLGQETGALWRGTRAEVFGDVTTRKR